MFWIARRAWEVFRSGQVSGVLQRHRVVADIHRDYPDWIRAEERRSAERLASYRRQAAQWPRRPRFSVIMPVYSPSLPFLEEAVQSVVGQHYGEWELCIVDDASPLPTHLERLTTLAREDPRIRVTRRSENGGIALATNDAIALATGDYCLFLDQDDRLADMALFEFAARAIERSGAGLIYADEDRIDARGVRSRPFFKPDWDPEWIRTTNYVLHPLAIDARCLRALGGLRPGLDGAQDWDLVLRAVEMISPEAIEHVPHVLYHWREHPGSTAAAIYEKSGIDAAQERTLRDCIERRGERAEVSQVLGGWRIHYQLPPEPPAVSFVICSRNDGAFLRRCVAGLRNCTKYPRWEAVVVDNGSSEREVVRLLDALPADTRFRVERDGRAFNHSAMCNRGVASARGDIVVLLDTAVEPIDPGWLTELVTHALREAIGLVGAMLYYPDETIQHAGVVLGLNGLADRPYLGYPRGFRGVDSRLLAVHSVSAMTTACVAIRRPLYLEVGGMDERLAVAYQDIDLCLRIGERGLRNILTPHAELYYHDPGSIDYHDGKSPGSRQQEDEEYFRAKWRGRLTYDPAYNANLSVSGMAYALRFDDSGREPG